MNLSELERVWVVITKGIKVRANRTYSVVIKRVKVGKELLSYSNQNLETRERLSLKIKKKCSKKKYPLKPYLLFFLLIL